MAKKNAVNVYSLKGEVMKSAELPQCLHHRVPA